MPVAPEPPVPTTPPDDEEAKKHPYECSYAGVPLNLTTDAAAEWLEEFALVGRTDTLRQGWPASPLATRSFSAAPAEPTPRLNSLCEPAGAGRWTVGRFLASDEQLKLIRQRLDAGGGAELTTDPSGSDSGSGPSCDVAGRQYRVLYLKTPQGEVKRCLRLLPPKPLGGTDKVLVWLLTFVDERFDQAQRPAPVEGPYEFWPEYLNQLDEIEPLYTADPEVKSRVVEQSRKCLRPARNLWTGCRWPAAVESACVACGLRFAPAVGLVDDQWAKQRVTDNLAKIQRYQGGPYSWGKFTGQSDAADPWLLDGLPTHLRLEIHHQCDDKQWALFQASVGGKARPWLLTAGGVICPLVTGSPDGSPAAAGSGERYQREAEVRAYVELLAERLKAWARVGFLDFRAPGVAAWRPDGVHDVEWVYRAGASYTHVRRAPFDDGVELTQVSACEEPDCCCGAFLGSGPMVEVLLLKCGKLTVVSN